VLVEAALVLGTFVLMMTGVLDLGLVMLRQNSLDAAARRVARAAVVRGSRAADGETWGPGRYVSRVSSAAGIASAAREALVTLEPAATIVEVTWPDGSNEPEQRVRVRLGYRHTSMIPMFYGRYLDLQSACVMRIAH
jgi:Flp pilus assembly protein TadG